MRKTGIILAILVMSTALGTAQEWLRLMTFNVRYDEALFNEGEPKKTDWDNRKDKLKIIRSGTFWLSETPEQVSRSWDAGYTRICTWAFFEGKKTKEQFFVFNTHFDSRGKEARLQSARLIKEKIKAIAGDAAVVVLGDFNFTPDSEPYKDLTDGSLADSRLVTATQPGGTEGTFNGFRLGAEHQHRIDFIFVGNRVKVHEYEVVSSTRDGIYPSDHFPVVIDASID